MLERPLIYLVPAAAAALYCAVCLETAPGLHLSLLLLSIFLAAAGAFIRRERLFTVMCMLAAASFAFSGFAAYRMIRVEPVRELAGRHAEITATLLQDPDISEDSLRAELSVDPGVLSVSDAIAALSGQVEITDLSVQGMDTEELVVSLYREFHI